MCVGAETIVALLGAMMPKAILFLLSRLSGGEELNASPRVNCICQMLRKNGIIGIIRRPLLELHFIQRNTGLPKKLC